MAELTGDAVVQPGVGGPEQARGAAGFWEPFPQRLTWPGLAALHCTGAGAQGGTKAGVTAARGPGPFPPAAPTPPVLARLQRTPEQCPLAPLAHVLREHTGPPQGKAATGRVLSTFSSSAQNCPQRSAGTAASPKRCPRRRVQACGEVLGEFPVGGMAHAPRSGGSRGPPCAAEGRGDRRKIPRRREVPGR